MEEDKKIFDGVDVKGLVEKVSNLEQDKSNLVSELKELRGSKQELEQKVKAIEDKTSETLTKFVSDQDKEKLTESIRKAEEKFKAKFTEFHPDNDQESIKFKALKEKLAKINTSSYKTEEEFYGAYEDAYVLLNKKLGGETKNLNGEFAASTQNSSSIRTVQNNNLSSKELKLIKNQGWDEERYMKMKNKRPEYVASLLHYMS